MGIRRAPRPIAEGDLPQSVTFDSEFMAALVATLAAYMPLNPTGIEMGEGDVNIIDAHTTAVPGQKLSQDFSVRLLFTSASSAGSGGGNLLVQGANVQINASVSINNSTSKISRLISNSFTVDLPAVGGGAIHTITYNIAGAQVGDMCLFTPTQMPSNLSFFKITSCITSAGVATLYFHNLFSASLDITVFQGRLLVLGFA